MIFVGSASLVAIICNSLFRTTLGWEPNYFYIYDYSGTPLKFLYNATPTSSYGWFSINWLYTLTLIAVFVGLFIGLFMLAKFLVQLVEKHNAELEESPDEDESEEGATI